jgi:hypothetical protein
LLCRSRGKGTIEASLRLIDALELEIGDCEHSVQGAISDAFAVFVGSYCSGA